MQKLTCRNYTVKHTVILMEDPNQMMERLRMELTVFPPSSSQINEHISSASEGSTVELEILSASQDSSVKLRSSSALEDSTVKLETSSAPEGSPVKLEITATDQFGESRNCSTSGRYVVERRSCSAEHDVISAEVSDHAKTFGRKHELTQSASNLTSSCDSKFNDRMRTDFLDNLSDDLEFQKSKQGLVKGYVESKREAAAVHGGVVWDTFRRQDAPKLLEYLRKHKKELCHIGNHSVNS